MSSEEALKGDAQLEVADETKSPIEPSPTTETKKRPRLDVSELGGGRDRKRGKSMFGILVGTLNKAKIEDKERSASEAAKKRHLIEQRLQAKLRKETDSVRRAEEAKKDKTAANRKEEDLQLKDSLYKLRRTRLPHLSNFLLTSDVIPADDDSTPPPSSTNPLVPPPRSHPPPLYYLPAVLTPVQETFISRRKAEVAEATDKEWNYFVEERKRGIEEIQQLRQRVADEEAKTNTGKEADMDTDAPQNDVSGDAIAALKDGEMEVDDGVTTNTAVEPQKKEDSTTVVHTADDDEAVEY